MQSNLQQQIQNDCKIAQNIGEQFLKAFFTPGVDTGNFYGNDSILTFEQETFIGKEDILSKIKMLAVNTIPNNYSVQPSSNGILIYFSGNCCIAGETNQMPFTRCIFLANSNGSYYIKNDIYKISFM